MNSNHSSSYLQDFSDTVHNADHLSPAERSELIARSPLGIFRLIHRVAHFLNSEAPGRELIPGRVYQR